MAKRYLYWSAPAGPVDSAKDLKLRPHGGPGAPESGADPHRYPLLIIFDLQVIVEAGGENAAGEISIHG